MSRLTGHVGFSVRPDVRVDTEPTQANLRNSARRHEYPAYFRVTDSTTPTAKTATVSLTLTVM